MDNASVRAQMNVMGYNRVGIKRLMRRGIWAVRYLMLPGTQEENT
jgi:hypothetical protein